MQNVNGEQIHDLLTTSTDQIITSNIKFGNISAGNVFIETINGVTPKRYVTSQSNNTRVVRGMYMQLYHYISTYFCESTEHEKGTFENVVKMRNLYIAHQHQCNSEKIWNIIEKS